MNKEKLPSINDELKATVGEDVAKKVETYYDSQVKPNANNAASKESFIQRTQEAYEKVGEVGYANYLQQVQNNIGEVREKLTNNNQSTVKPKN